MNQYFGYQEDIMFDLQIHTIMLIESLRTWTSSRIPGNRHEVCPVRMVRFLKKDQSPLENRDSRTASTVYTRATSDRMKSIKLTHDDTRSFDQPKRKINKPFMIDEPSNRYRKQIIKSPKTIKWTNGDKQVPHQI